MWPWEHLAVGYVLGSLYVHVVHRRRPTFVEFVAILLASQLPDLVDKPLSWTLSIAPNGTSVAHSVLVTAPILITVWLVSLVFRRGSVPMVFGLAYAAHLAGDVFYDTLVYGDRPKYRAILWPFAWETQSERTGLITNFTTYFGEYLEFIMSPTGTWYFIVQVLLIAFVVALWLYDDAPGWKQLVDRLAK